MDLPRRAGLMIIIQILLTVNFIILLLLITLEKIKKLIGGVIGGLIVFILLLVTEGFVLQRPPSVAGMDLLGFIDFEVIFMILGIFVSVEAIRESGFFQWLGIKGIKATRGRAYPLFILLALVSSFLSGFVTSIAVMIIVGNLTIDTARVLDINPLPYLAAEAITVNVGVLITPIASIPNIIIMNESTSIGILPEASFGFYATNLAPFSLFLIPLTIFVLLKRFKVLEDPSEDRREFLMEFDEWTVVADRTLFKRTAILFITMIASFIIIPNILPQVKLWLVSITFMVLFLVLPKIKPGKLVRNIDWDTIFFLIGLFIMVGGLEHEGVLDTVAESMGSALGGNVIYSILVLFLFAAFASGVIDNIAVTIVLIPIITHLVTASSALQAVAPVLISTLIIGVNLGGNLTPMASPTTVLAMSLSKKAEEELTPAKFFKIGFSVTLFQISIAIGYLILSFLFVSLFGSQILTFFNIAVLIVAIVNFSLLLFRERLSFTAFIDFFHNISSKIRKGSEQAGE